MVEWFGYFKRSAFAILALACWQACFTADARTESEVKATFFVTLARYTEWPADAFESETSPLVIGVLGPDNPFGSILKSLTTNEAVLGRSFDLQQFATVDDIKVCHLLFVSSKLTPLRMELALQKLRNRPILTVSDTSQFLERGGMIEVFLNSERRIRFKIATDAVTRAGLQLSPALTRLTERAWYSPVLPGRGGAGLVQAGEFPDIELPGGWTRGSRPEPFARP